MNKANQSVQKVYWFCKNRDPLKMHSGETCETLLPPHTKIPFRGIFFVWRRGILILTGSVQVVGTFFAHSKVPGNLFKSSRKVPRALLPGYTKIPFRGFLLCDYTTKLALISNLEANSQRAERVVIRYLHVRIGVRGGATSPYRSGTPCQYFSSVKILVKVLRSAPSTAHRFNPYGLIIL